MAQPKSKRKAPPRVRKWKPRFLAAYRELCSVTMAAMTVKVNRSTVYDARRDDPKFRADFDAIANQQNELLEASALRRATFGVAKPHYHLGVVCGTERVYPDALTQFLIERRMPQKYGRFGGDVDDGELGKKLLAFRAAERATQQGPPEVEALRAQVAAMQAQLDALNGAAKPDAAPPAEPPAS